MHRQKNIAWQKVQDSTAALPSIASCCFLQFVDLSNVYGSSLLRAFFLGKRLPVQVFFNLLSRRNFMDLFCYYEWDTPRVQDIAAFEVELHGLH